MKDEVEKGRDESLGFKGSNREQEEEAIPTDTLAVPVQVKIRRKRPIVCSRDSRMLTFANNGNNGSKSKGERER